MIDKKAFEVQRVNPEENSSSPQIFSTELIDNSIEDVRNKKKTVVSKLDSVTSLMRKVECEEKAAEQAKEEADRCSFDILVKVNERKQALIEAEKTKDTLVRKVNVQKAVVATKMEVVQSCMQHLLDDGDRCLEVLDEMTRSLETRLTSALLKKELAIRKKQENEAFSQVVLAYDFKMEKIVEESRRWKQEALKFSKLLEFLKDRGHVVDMLYGEISDECQDVNRLKEEMDQAIPLGGLLSSNLKLSSLAASSSSLKSSKSDRVKDVVLEADIKIPDMVEVITEGQAMSFECNDFEGNPREVNKLCGNQMFAKNGSVFSPEVLDLTEDEYLIEKFALAGVSMVTSLALAIHYPTIAAAPHMLINGYKNALAIAVETEYSFPLADKVKEYLADPSKFAVAAPVAPAAGGALEAAAAAPAEEKKEEAAKESDDDMGFSLLD